MSDAASRALSDYVFGISPMTESPKVTRQSFRATKILPGWRRFFWACFKGKQIFSHVSTLSSTSLYNWVEFQLFNIFIRRMWVLLGENIVHLLLIVGKLLCRIHTKYCAFEESESDHIFNIFLELGHIRDFCTCSDKVNRRCGAFYHN